MEGKNVSRSLASPSAEGVNFDPNAAPPLQSSLSGPLSSPPIPLFPPPPNLSQMINYAEGPPPGFHFSSTTSTREAVAQQSNLNNETGNQPFLGNFQQQQNLGIGQIVVDNNGIPPPPGFGLPSHSTNPSFAQNNQASTVPGQVNQTQQQLYENMMMNNGKQIPYQSRFGLAEQQQQTPAEMGTLGSPVQRPSYLFVSSNSNFGQQHHSSPRMMMNPNLMSPRFHQGHQMQPINNMPPHEMGMGISQFPIQPELNLSTYPNTNQARMNWLNNASPRTNAPQFNNQMMFPNPNIPSQNSRLIRNAVYDPSYEALGLPVDPHLRAFLRSDNNININKNNGGN